MAVMQDKYPNLPGHLTEFKDGGLQLVQEANPPKTESILILGTAVDGPVMEPVKVDASTYELVFGKIADDKGIPNGATLGQAFEEAYAGGCRDIRLMRVSGAPATASVLCTAGTRLEEAVYEKTLGAAIGNTGANSVISLSKRVREVVEVKINGTVALLSEYEVIKEDVNGKYVGTDGKTYDVSELDSIKYIEEGLQKVVVKVADDAIYKKDEEEVYATGTDLGGETTGYTLVVDVAQYVKAFGETLKDTILSKQPQAEELKTGLGLENILFEKATTYTIRIKDNVCDAGSYVDVKYIDDETGLLVSENSSPKTGSFIANGDVIEFQLDKGIIPYTGMTKLYFDGVEYIESDTTNENATVKVFEVIVNKEISTTTVKVNPGRHAKRGVKIEVRLPYKKTVDYTAELRLETAFGGAVYNGTQWQIDTVYYPGEEAENVMTEKILKITKPRSKRSQENEEPLKYSSFDYPTIGLMARAINNDTNNGGFVKAYVNDEDAQTPTVSLEGGLTAVTFTGGEDGVNLTKQEMFVKLSGSRDAQGYLVEAGAYQLLENYTVDYVVPTGVRADEKLAGRFEDFAYELALFCAVVSHRNHTTIGCIPTSSPNEPTLRAIEAHVAKLEAYDNSYLMRDAKGDVIRDTDGNAIDLGMYINIIAGGDVVMVNQRLGQYSVNSAAGFVGYLSTLAVNSAPTNKVLKYAGGLRVKFSNSQLDRLTAKRFITLKYKGDGKTVAVVDAMTSALPGSDYERVSSMRAVRELANETREVADPFLGEPNTPEQRNSLAALLDKRYNQHKEAGTIRDYSFNIQCTAYDELVGAAKIMLTIVPAQELRTITTVIALKPSI